MVYGYNLQKQYCKLLSEFMFYLNSVDPDEMPHYAAFHLGLHWVYTVCVSTPLEASSIQRINSYLIFFFKIDFQKILSESQTV